VDESVTGSVNPFREGSAPFRDYGFEPGRRIAPYEEGSSSSQSGSAVCISVETYRFARRTRRKEEMG
jgi:hypothetical protein